LLIRHLLAEGRRGVVVKARDGSELKVTLSEKPQIAGIVKASLSDIKQGSFVGVTAMPKADGSMSALEVHIFPESMRGTGEGHYPWDLRPQSTMTNANVDQIVTAVDGEAEAGATRGVDLDYARDTECIGITGTRRGHVRHRGGSWRCAQGQCDWGARESD
jgi:hypothetical protein